MNITTTVGTWLPEIVQGPLTSSWIVRWCAAQENWDKIHYDLEYARNVAKLPHTVVNGALKQHLAAQFLLDTFGTDAWIWRLKCRFLGMDHVGHRLRFRGRVAGEERCDDGVLVHVDIRVLNLERAATTTEVRATIVLSESGRPVLDALSLYGERSHLAHIDPVVDDGVPASISQRLGGTIEQIVSCCPVELGRLRLFSDAISNRHTIYYDAVAGIASSHGCVVAPPLFPIHAISEPPGARELSGDPNALGREGVCEVGRNLAQMFGLPPQGLLNGANEAQIHSLARVGETVKATSRLAAARCRRGKNGGLMLILDTVNEYDTTTGRPLLTERQSTIFRIEAGT